MNIFYKNVATNFVTIISFCMRMFRKVEDLFFMMQSWFRAQFGNLKLAKMNEPQFLCLVFCKIRAKYHDFFLKM